jgi:hypothetical protein
MSGFSSPRAPKVNLRAMGFCGVDNTVNPELLQMLSIHYTWIEWGMLVCNCSSYIYSILILYLLIYLFIQFFFFLLYNILKNLKESYLYSFNFIRFLNNYLSIYLSIYLIVSSRYGRSTKICYLWLGSKSM